MADDPDCLFCRIIRKEIPSEILFEDDDVLAFRDINPQAPVHFLVIPKKHIDSLAAVSEADERIVGRITAVINKIAESQGLMTAGYRVVTNIGREAGQTVQHLHFHVLGGRKLQFGV